ncbi:MAG: hypothetical protein L3J01_00640 [Thiomicrorhabdus sp.]|nr:hypothetical protein [Thiomicrorhabdus sp.]
MAASDETIDPNDLDSIDALLDEAELEVAEKKETTESEDQDAIDSLLDDITLPEPVEGAEPKESEEDLLPEPEPEEGNTNGLAQGAPVEVDKKSEPAIKKAVSEEKISPVKPSVTQPNPTQEMTAEDMDSIKKLIIIFGSALVVLALVGIGIGVWSVLAAKGAALDDETKTLIESTQVNAERMAANSMDTSESIQTLEKKIDALNFQLEELSTDLLALQTTAPGSLVKKTEVIDPLGLNTHSSTVSKTTQSSVTTPVEHARQPDIETAKLASLVNKKMISAQRRIDEVNRRVKDIQSKHKALLLSIKNLEKQLVLQQKKVAAKEQEAKVKKQPYNPYQYSAPDATYYDQSVGDSYP